MKVDPALIHRLFYPQVPLVLSAMLGGRVSAMPVVSYASVSDNPPLVAVSCAQGGFTCRLALKAKSFSLSVLDRRSADAISRLASVSGAKVKDKLTDAGLKYRKGARLNVPLIEGAQATLECSLAYKKTFGDHTLLVGLVKSAAASGSFNGFWDFGAYRPLLYTGWQGKLTTYPET